MPAAALELLPLPSVDATGGRIIVTSPYGLRWGSLHAGTDMGSSDGIEIGVECYAVFSGVIAAVLDDGSWPGAVGAGKNVHLLCDNGRRFKYFHLNGASVRAGQRVQQIGRAHV